MHNFFLMIATILALTSLICLIRAIKGPTRGDRIIGINIVGTKTNVIIAVLAFFLRETYFIDVVLVYALISFIGSIFIAREFSSENQRGGSTHA